MTQQAYIVQLVIQFLLYVIYSSLTTTQDRYGRHFYYKKTDHTETIHKHIAQK